MDPATAVLLLPASRGVCSTLYTGAHTSDWKQIGLDFRLEANEILALTKPA